VTDAVYTPKPIPTETYCSPTFWRKAW